MMEKAIMVDIDGTIANKNDRDPYDWDSVGEDIPVPNVIQVVKALWIAGFSIIFMSGRKEICRSRTEMWINEHFGNDFDFNEAYSLYMREDFDNRGDEIVKVELYEKYVKPYGEVVMVFDDRKKVVDAWRAIGLTVAQVAEGNF